MAPYALPDADLLAACREDAMRSGGPGGQHANKTASAVRLVHRDSGTEVRCQDHRSRERNRVDALRRLRVRLACQLRGLSEPAWLQPWVRGGRLAIGAQAEAYPQVAACLLDALAAAQGALAEAAPRCGLSTTQFAKALAADGEVRQAANAIRAAAGLGAIHD